jgi:hypothetical protein
MTTTFSPPPIFTSLGPRISLSSPPNHVTGELIILCTWLGAHSKHIAKYTAIYRSIAPGARILLLESDVRSITSSYAAQRSAIIPATDVVRSVLDESNTPKILLHTFSNGGPNCATQLLIVLRSTLGAPLPLIGILCDSGPAAGSYWKNYNAMVLSLPKGLARAIGVPVIHVILILLAASVALGRYDKLEDTIRETLLSGEYVQGRKRICYVYSKEDEMVDWRDVVGHADMARGKGWVVHEWEAQGTAHCGHLRGHEEIYGEKMRRLWEGEELTLEKDVS